MTNHKIASVHSRFKAKKRVLLVSLPVIVVLGTLLFFVLSNTGYVGSLVNRSTLTCTSSDGLRVCTSINKKRVTYLDEVKVKVTIKNPWFGTYEAGEYMNSNVKPNLYVNGEIYDYTQVASPVITNPEIEAFGSLGTDYSIDTSKLKLGENTISVKWNYDKVVGSTLQFTLLPKTADVAQKLKSCIGDTGEHIYCGVVAITFKKGTYPKDAKCSYYDKYFQSLGLKTRTANSACFMSDYGLVNVNVPKDEINEWAAKIRTVPEVESASASSLFQ